MVMPSCSTCPNLKNNLRNIQKNLIGIGSFNHANCLPSAISTAVITRQGEVLYMQSSSELQRVALSARHCLQIKCTIPALCRVKADADVQQEDGNPVSELGVAAEEQAIAPSTDIEKVNGASEINTTIVSCEPETSFGDMTMDSIKDHLT